MPCCNSADLWDVMETGLVWAPTCATKGAQTGADDAHALALSYPGLSIKAFILTAQPAQVESVAGLHNGHHAAWPSRRILLDDRVFLLQTSLSSCISRFPLSTAAQGLMSCRYLTKGSSVGGGVLRRHSIDLDQSSRPVAVNLKAVLTASMPVHRWLAAVEKLRLHLL